ncbi:VCBS repeat-containing protein [Candidatus Poribacteria bacterium]|nr:VCBS repeat-containing protein [Candidatus Poribacteria bacterium]
MSTRKLSFITCFIITIVSVSILSSLAQDSEIELTVEEAIRQHNLGLAYLEESQPTKALVAFTKLIELLPDEAIGYGNLAVAHLRLQQSEEAEKWVKQGITVTPMESQLHFILSEVYQLKGETELAVASMEEAVRLDPEQLEFRYKLVRHYLGQRRNAEAQRQAFIHLKELNSRSPVNVVILLKLTQALIAQGEFQQAETLSQQLLILLGDTEADKLKYLTQGIEEIGKRNKKTAARNLQIFENVQRASPRYQQGIGELVTNILGHPIESFTSGFKARITAKKSEPISVEFTDITDEIGLNQLKAASTDYPHISLIDYDNDGNLDIFISKDILLKNDDGNLKSVKGIAEIIGEISNPNYTTYADLDKNGTLEILQQDAYGISQLRMIEDGNWEKTNIIQYHTPKNGTGVLQTFDYDHDGDLDIFSGQNGVNIYQNNGDGVFADVSESAFVSNEDREFTLNSIIHAFIGDFDDDGDLDLFTINQDVGCILFDNLRQGKLRAVSTKTDIPQDVKYTSVSGGDYDNDGNIDLLLATSSGIKLYRNRGDATFIRDTRSVDVFSFSSKYNTKQIHSLDYDNDGFLDIWVISPHGLLLFRNDGTGRFTDTSSIIDVSNNLNKGISGSVADYDNDGDLDLFYLAENGQFCALKNSGGNQNNWLQVRLEGITTGNNKVNRDGMGSKLEVKVRDLYQLQYVSQQVSHFGLGSFEGADVVRVVWTNGVPQNVIEPKAKQRIMEKQILKGSCPFLYVYDGENYQFVTDLLWRAPLGLVTSMGFVAPDETRDFVKIAASQIQPKSGKYSIQITEELWETAYFDMVKLIAVDHPENTDIFVNEQYKPPPFDDFKIYTVFDKRLPKSAKNHRGEDISERLKSSDYQYANEHVLGPYQGVVDKHAIILDLGHIPDNDSVRLYLNGWIFPTDTSINIALSQNPDIAPNFPSVAVKDSDGKWKTVIPMIGIPAGKNKTITVDLTNKFLSDDRHVRIETDMQIYWDAVFYTVGNQNVPMTITELTPDTADLHYRGFSEMYRPNPHAPHLFDYHTVTTLPQWRDLEGFYTRFGDVKTLLQEVDDMYVILNAGDEITVEFNATRLPSLKQGWIRDFILYSDGWDKDGDINTLTSQTVSPLPFHKMTKYPYPESEHFPNSMEHLRYQLEYNTRRVTHELPPLPDKDTP